MIIACSVDSYFAELAGVLMKSVAINGGVPGAELIILGDRLTRRDRIDLAGAASPLYIHIMDLDEECRHRVAGLPTSLNWPRAIYGRMLLPDLLNGRSGRLLYLDSDMVVQHSLAELETLELEKLPLAAVPGPHRHLDRDPSIGYFESGTLLIDLEEWRRRDIGTAAIDWLRRNRSARMPDQDALNMAVGRDYVKLPKKWNLSPRTKNGASLAEIAEAHILHFVGTKPHRRSCTTRGREIYLAVRAQTPWKDTPLMSDTSEEIRKRKHQIGRALSRLGRLGRRARQEQR